MLPVLQLLLLSLPFLLSDAVATAGAIAFTLMRRLPFKGGHLSVVNVMNPITNYCKGNGLLLVCFGQHRPYGAAEHTEYSTNALILKIDA